MVNGEFNREEADDVCKDFPVNIGLEREVLFVSTTNTLIYIACGPPEKRMHEDVEGDTEPRKPSEEAIVLNTL